MKKTFKLMALAVLACATVVACNNNKNTETVADTLPCVDETMVEQAPEEEVAEAIVEETETVKETVKKEATKAANKVVTAAAETATEVATEAVKEEAQIITNTTAAEKEALKAKTKRKR